MKGITREELLPKSESDFIDDMFAYSDIILARIN